MATPDSKKFPPQLPKTIEKKTYAKKTKVQNTIMSMVH